MSHFTVLVVGRKENGEFSEELVKSKLAELLHPFEEQSDSPENDERFKFEVEYTLEQAQEKYQEYLNGCASPEVIDEAYERFFEEITSNEHYADFMNRTSFDVDFAEGVRKYFKFKHPYTEKDFEMWCEVRNVKPFNVRYRQLADQYNDVFHFMEDYGYGNYNKEAQGFGWYRNPDAQWDWWQLGGRWSGLLSAKHPELGIRGDRSWANEKEKLHPFQCDACQIKNLDFEKMKEVEIRHAEDTWKAAWQEFPEIEVSLSHPQVLNALKEITQNYTMPTTWEVLNMALETPNKIAAGHREFIYGIKEGQTKEGYIRERSKFSTFAVLKDGEWHERGDMGWWGIVIDEKPVEQWRDEFEEMFNSLDPEDWIAIVDCHI